MTTKKKAASSAFQTEAIYNVRVSRAYYSERFKCRFLPAHPYKVKGKVAEELKSEDALKSSELFKDPADLKTKDPVKKDA